MTDLEDTIVALSSASGPGARAVVRLSGPGVLGIVDRVFVADAPLSLERCRREGVVRLPSVKAHSGEKRHGWILEALCHWRSGRRSS